MIQVGKNGFVQLIDTMPRVDDIISADKRIVNSARISYGMEATADFTEKDRGLIFFLMENRHSSPFEMVEFLFHVKAPIFVARQWFRHRTFSYNEISARYTEVSDESGFFEVDDIRVQSTTNYQASEGALDTDVADEFREYCNGQGVRDTYEKYKYFVENGVPKEQARMILPQSMMTEFYVKGNLKNWFHFLSLRREPGAQKEIRDYANAIESIIEEVAPVSMAAHKKFNGGVHFTDEELSLLSRPEHLDLPEDWSRRKTKKLIDKLNKFQ